MRRVTSSQIEYTIVLMDKNKRDIDQEDLGFVSATKAKSKLVSRLRAHMKVSPYVAGAYIRLTHND